MEIAARDFNNRGLKLSPVGLKADVISRIRPALVARAPLDLPRREANAIDWRIGATVIIHGAMLLADQPSSLAAPG